MTPICMRRLREQQHEITLDDDDDDETTRREEQQSSFIAPCEREAHQVTPWRVKAAEGNGAHCACETAFNNPIPFQL